MSEQAQNIASDLPIACTLPEAELVKRVAEIDEHISSGVQSVNELPDGYEFHFPGTEEWPTRLLHFISGERKCCRFLTFELLFAPNEGPIALRLRGPEGTKDFIRNNII